MNRVVFQWAGYLCQIVSREKLDARRLIAVSKPDGGHTGRSDCTSNRTGTHTNGHNRISLCSTRLRLLLVAALLAVGTSKCSLP